MSTRSYIGIKVNNKIEYVYCHWDGYVRSGVGEELLKNYNTPSSVRKLLAGGNISTLVDKYETYEMMGRVHGREGYIDSEAEFLVEVENVDYAYVMVDGIWIVHGHGNEGWMLLSDAMKEAA